MEYDQISNDWAVVVGDVFINILPLGDIDDHLVGDTCPCCPQMDDEGNLIHSSWDEREKFDTGERKVS
ncbi:BcepGomrgp03 [Burkholderia phage BcepGomr]|uniref:BcepGomrgp03 n=1 Tax=Burkholderia phage BcepGomr TaxID=437329 RepID=UPI0001503468|nr:BcepGomrgp03 [Burkholderia phage BcepGomr]ABP63574.1 BcepGomrgp03 [Burkholderia phage BcepGomr]